MNEHTEKLVRELAEKLGTTVEHLWEIMVRQAPIDAIPNWVGVFFFGTLAVLLANIIRRNWKALWDDDGDLLLTALVVGALICVALVAMNFADIATALFNPEYWALKQLLK